MVSLTFPGLPPPGPSLTMHWGVWAVSLPRTHQQPLTQANRVRDKNYHNSSCFNAQGFVMCEIFVWGHQYIQMYIHTYILFEIVKPWPQTLSPKPLVLKPKPKGLGLTLKSYGSPQQPITFKHIGGVQQQNQKSKTYSKWSPLLVCKTSTSKGLVSCSA